MSKPATTPAWADDSLSPPNPAADISTPDAARVSTGFQVGQPVIAGHMNWLLHWLCEWVQHLTTAPGVYASQEAAIADTEIGEIVIVDESAADGVAAAGEGGSTYATNGKAAGTDILRIVSDGYRVWYTETGTVVARGQLRGAPGTDTVALTFTGAGNAFAIVSDGYYVVVAHGSIIECFLASTGVSQWTYDHLVQVEDVCFAGEYVFYGGARSVTPATCRRLNRATGAVVGAPYDHNGTVYSVAWANGRYYIAGAASAWGSLATFRALNESLEDAAGEGGAADTLGRAWDVATIAPNVIPSRGGMLATDGRYLFVGYLAGAAQQIERRNLITGAVVDSITIANHDVMRLCVDQGGLIFATEDSAAANRGYAWGCVRDSLDLAWKYQHTAGRTIFGIHSDGSRVWFASEIAAAENGIGTICRGPRPNIFRRQDFSTTPDSKQDRGPSGLRRLLVPVE